MTALSREQVRLSKRVSLVLRHRPEVAGLTLDPNRWVRVDAAGLAAAGQVFRHSADGVWLTDAVPPSYLGAGTPG